MSTVLVYTSPAQGHLYPIVDVALALRDAGHEVVVQTLASEAARLPGLRHRPIAPAIEALTLDDHLGATPLHQLRAATSCWATRAPHEVADLRAALDELDPDLLLVDANCWGAAALAETAGRPWCLFQPYVLPVPSVDAPAFGPGLPPPRGWLGRMRDRLIWWVQHQAARPALARCNDLRAELGARPLVRLSEVYDRPDLVLYRTAPPFDDVRRDMPATVVHRAGPVGAGRRAPA